MGDEQTTLAGLKAQIEETIAAVERPSEAAFAGAEDRDIRFVLIDDLSVQMTGAQFLTDWSLPHFYFHLVTAYDILRHHGVELGKRDYMSHIAYAVRRGEPVA